MGRRRIVLVGIAGLAIGCGDDRHAAVDASADAAPDATIDGAADASLDAALDAAIDAAIDAAPPVLGVLRDPAITSNEAWQASGGVVIDGAAPGGIDVGQALFGADARCRLGRLEQTIEMPTATRSTFVLELVYRHPAGDDPARMGVSFGGALWSPLPGSPAAFERVRLCAPAGGFARPGSPGGHAPVTFAFGSYERAASCTAPAYESAIDHAELVPAVPGECGERFGEGVNFDGEGSGGWTFATSGTATAGYAAGAGANGSRAPRVELHDDCDVASVSRTVDVPSFASPALEMFVRVSARSLVTLRSSTTRESSLFDAVPTSATSATLRRCLPPALRGQTFDLTLQLSRPATWLPICGPAERSLAIDDVRVVDDPACDWDGRIADGGFEHPALPWGAGGIADLGRVIAAVRDVPGQAHGGSRYLALEAYSPYASAAYELLPVVPPVLGGAGPALRFWANAGANPDARTYVTVEGRAAPLFDLVEGAGWIEYTVCLDTRHTGRHQRVTIHHDPCPAGLVCRDLGYPQQDALVDDVVVTHSFDCPP